MARATKNPYKKHAMVFAKNKERTIIVERTGDNIYISEGFSMLRIPYIYYEFYIRPLSPLFVQLEDGQKATRESKSEIPTIGYSDGSLARIFDNTKATLETTVTCFMYDDPYCNRNLHLVNVGKRLVAYNDEFMRATMEYATAFNATNDRHPVLKFEDEIGVGCIIMPVNSESFAADLETLRKFL